MFLEGSPVTDMTNTHPSLIETLRTTDAGDIPLFARHLRRLQASARTLNYPCPRVEIEQSLRAMAHQNQGQAQRLRLLLHADGRFESSHQPLASPGDHLVVVLAAARLHTPDIWLQHKTTHRPLYQQAALWLQACPEYFDCLFLNQHDQLCEGSRSNVYLRLDGHWYTPPLTCGVLPGVMRETLLESGQVRERILHLDELMLAQGVRVSNAVLGWLDVHYDPERQVQNLTTSAAP